MAKIKTVDKNDFNKGLVGVCKVHFGLVLLFIAQIVLYDSAKLIEPEVVLQRWIVVAALLAMTGSIWYLAKTSKNNLFLNKALLLALIATDIGVASFFVYSTRGMASRELFLYVFPIVIAGLMLTRAALFATAILCIAAYSLTAVAYFVNYFNEGYKVELYGEVGFFSLGFLLLAGLLAAVLHPRK